MKKINNAVGTSPPQHNFKKAYLVTIVAISSPRGQSQGYKRLVQAVHRRELTTSLEILDASGIEGDLAILLLANLQSLEVAR
ncbi:MULTISPECIES: hypothetical protein [unclassified Tolypothrix]|uniref:hypothetical protein n=1 Tax=unclassified Tolypothrix TaxID=2649714 RepID=UPI0005EABBA8|nr:MULTISPECIES: hypothetical protein [unclassified Tolypothrix]EKE96423.1 hypothetical protein FDUTEX481_09769 [Tolypothrix sp. PCC 7601]MBE9084143.1 hypothetical protein [Tolypothrix sp. LEGE 11397]BAY96017.1 hypothetical protein NIES3275_80940 [Microchaete diplosiphon NIES-3275]